MTVKQLIEKLQDFSENMEVGVRVYDDEHDFAPVENLDEIEVEWNEGFGSEPPKGEKWPKEKVLVISEG